MVQPVRGHFFVLDGPEGAGKSLQAARLAEALRSRGLDVLLTREPGGTPTGEALRAVLLGHDLAGMCPLTELMVVCAARTQHVAEVIRPALEQGRIAVCDRFSPSTFVYQGYAGGVALETVRVVDAVARQGVRPDCTILLDVPAEVGLSRGLAVCAADRMEGKGLDFHRRVREGYLAYAQAAEEPCVVVSGSSTPDEVASHVWATILEYL